MLQCITKLLKETFSLSVLYFGPGSFYFHFLLPFVLKCVYSNCSETKNKGHSRVTSRVTFTLTQQVTTGHLQIKGQMFHVIIYHTRSKLQAPMKQPKKAVLSVWILLSGLTEVNLKLQLSPFASVSSLVVLFSSFSPPVFLLMCQLYFECTLFYSPHRSDRIFCPLTWQSVSACLKCHLKLKKLPQFNSFDC